MLAWLLIIIGLWLAPALVVGAVLGCAIIAKPRAGKRSALEPVRNPPVSACADA